ncbi:hypothetical protein CcCBS67573_g09001 [Chytriomyces confervae]|uniref:J domain-containing protein n=1 Tax=Chytriomyces confervae TaxID=246404 RepID=A0A507EAM7_9FUNG|nr:hypothetical protein HDU80_009527 [Chytriomyces hyalinus]TPX60437.1 hypothetical protein CcCBS67573_g09001 [Chytriomyces confervae]
MRSSVLTFLLICCLSLCALAWEKEDYAIFDLHDKLVKIKGEKDAQGKRIDFYGALEVPHTATPIQISRAYRKQSLELHPDKNPAPEAASLYALLTSINKVLKDKDMRERYNKHRSTGIPTWRGTGYYVARYKPGLPFILSFLVIAISIGQYLIQEVQYRQIKHKIDTTVFEVVETKTSNDLTYTNLRRMLKKAGHPEPPAAVKKAIRNGVAVAEILKMPELDGLLTIEHQEEEFRDEGAEAAKYLETLKPSISKTLVVQLPETIIGIPAWIGSLGKKKEASEVEHEVAEAVETQEESGSEEVIPKKASKKARSRKNTTQQQQQPVDAEGVEAEPEKVEKKPKRKNTSTGNLVRSSSGQVMTKAEFIKKTQKEQAKLAKSE